MLRSLTRITSFFYKWFAEVVREPTLMLSLVLGPFLILFLFGVGTRVGGVPKPRTIVVAAEQPQGALPGPTPEDVGSYLTIVDTTTNQDEAVARLARGEVDLVAVLPTAPEQIVLSGKRAPLTIFTNEIDPLKDSYARAYLAYQIGELNQQAVQRAIEEGQDSVESARGFIDQAQRRLDLLRQARNDAVVARRELTALKNETASMNTALNQTLLATGGAGAGLTPLRNLSQSLNSLSTSLDTIDRRVGQATDTTTPTEAELDSVQRQLTAVDQAASQLKSLPAEVLSAPFELRITNVAPFEVATLPFYAPAVLALLLQHLAVTLGALSLARVRLLGLMELLQTSPVRPSEVVIGNYLSYGTLCLVAGAALVALLVVALQVPITGSLLLFAGTLGLLTLASLGIGFIISLLARSEQQAAQIAMLVLISSVFFSGFMIFLESIEWPIRALSFLLPATYAIRSLRDIMLRGIMMTPYDLAILGATALVLFIITVMLFRREFRPR
jgi:ABC-2 type transport system permease protein